MSNKENVAVKQFKCGKSEFSTIVGAPQLPQLDKHLKEVHYKVYNEKCPQCDYSSQTLGDMVLHTKVKHGEKPSIAVKLEEENSLTEAASSNTAPDLKGKEMHKDGEQESLQVLKDHDLQLDVVKARTEEGKKSWVCPEEGCKKAYPRPSKLKVHLMGHNNIKPFKCVVKHCIWAFPTAFKLKRHMNSHEKLKTAVCIQPSCGKEFYDVYSLKKHQTLFHMKAINKTQPTKSYTSTFK